MSITPYDHKSVEPKWQSVWEKQQPYAAPSTVDGKKAYILDMFPYPSGAGLHVGHPEGYTATDILSRYKRMNGVQVLHPMGWDAFGLPAENYAIKTGVHPAESTATNIDNFRRQIKSLGFSYDWEREINTSSPEYYKWTQWIFTQLFNKGLAYKKAAKVNWCNTCQTVLANEQVIDGKCERSDDEVIQKDLEQWFFKTTDYAEQLLNDLDSIDWPEPIKLMQKNWIGKSKGAQLQFAVAGSDSEYIEVFTTRPDTLFGATYMVIAPEHALVEQLTTPDQQEAVAAYIEEAGKKTDLQRTVLAKEKSGVFTGSYAINPATGAEVPVWIADYVLASYGTGAIMAVPAHDERDYEFAKQYDLEITAVVAMEDGSAPDVSEQPYTEYGVLINSGEYDGLSTEEAKPVITKKVGGTLETTYRLRDWLISRQRYWGAPIPIVYDPEGNAHPVKEEHLPLTLPTDVDYKPKGTSPLGSSESYKALAEELYGEGWRFEIDTMDTFVCSSWYYLRYCDPHNADQFASSKALEQWLPADMYVGGAEHAVLHLMYARFFHKALQDMGHIPTSVGREPFAALRNQGMILGPDHQKMSKSKGNVINPDDVVEEYGADTLRMYEMFMGPFEDVKPWSTDSIKGVRRFLEKVWKLSQSVSGDHEAAEDELRVLHQTIKKITEDIESFGFNTAIAQMMICVNALLEQEQVSVQTYTTLLQLLAPFAPHMVSELADQMGEEATAALNTWPAYNEEYLVESTVTMAVQVQGKVRGQVELAPDATEEQARTAAEANTDIAKHLEGKEVVKFVYVPGRIMNFVVK